MFEAYSVAVRLRLLDQVTPALLLLSKQFAATSWHATELQRKLTAIKLQVATGAGLFGAGAVIAAPLLYAVDKAAELQKQMIGIQIATRGSVKEMDQMRGAIEKVAGITMFSNIDVAKMAKVIASGTGLSAPQVQNLLPVYAKFADVQLLQKGTPYEKSVTDAIRLAHTAQHYDADSLRNYLDLLTKASFLVPGGLGEVGHALKYSQGIGKTALGIDDENMILLTAMMNRLGMPGSRGGTNTIAAMARTIPGVFGSGLLTGKSGEALQAMGMVDAQGHSRLFENGKFSPFLWMGRMGEYVERAFATKPEAIARQEILSNFQHAFGVQGGRVASLLSSPQAIEQFRQIGATFSQFGGVEGYQKKYADESVSQQWMNAKTNFQSAMTEMGYTLLPAATDALKGLNTQLANFTSWITQNQDTVKGFMTGLGVLATALAGAGLVKGIQAIAGTFGVLETAVIGLNPALGLLLSTLGRAAGAISLGAGAGALIGSGISWLADNYYEKQGRGSFGSAWYDFLNEEEESRVAHELNRVYPGKRPPPSGSPFVQPRSGSSTINLTVNSILDKRKVAESVTKVQVEWGKAPEVGLSLFDGTMALHPAGGGG